MKYRTFSALVMVAVACVALVGSTLLAQQERKGQQGQNQGDRGAERVDVCKYYLGIHMDNRSWDVTLGGTTFRAVRIVAVDEKSPAEKAGLKAGYYITRVNKNGGSASQGDRTEYYTQVQRLICDSMGTVSVRAYVPHENNFNNFDDIKLLEVTPFTGTVKP